MEVRFVPIASGDKRGHVMSSVGSRVVIWREPAGRINRHTSRTTAARLHPVRLRDDPEPTGSHALR